MSGLVERLSGEYAWAIWLAAPLLITLFASLWMWWRGRARGVPAAGSAIKAHHRYLDTLSAVAASTAQPSRPAAYSAAWSPTEPEAASDEPAEDGPDGLEEPAKQETLESSS
ncbi:hypothetical protein SAMN05892883_2484 [Jatrophihabitans sp. GAS493]|uniref:hypothetical protein n=1 Tax=Jatrophihabitans sp. GAS493 TaxID=1907575 RepID=UPI000BB98848|nr:hypothetical protein [Jatrophihabitans sp. GAS493]SOD73195.1 hypothetical protein SAMN05892883_2484 [Jatrophihabitans sp. GAS493]